MLASYWLNSCGTLTINVDFDPGLLSSVVTGECNKGTGSLRACTGDLDLCARDIELCAWVSTCRLQMFYLAEHSNVL
jgi:hypothetical protein